MVGRALKKIISYFKKFKKIKLHIFWILLVNHAFLINSTYLCFFIVQKKKTKKILKYENKILPLHSHLR